MAQKDAKSCQKCQFCERENWNPPICFWVAWVSYMSCPELHWWCCSNLDHCRIYLHLLPLITNFDWYREISNFKLPSSEEMILPQCHLAEEMSFQVNQGTWLGEGVPSVDRKLLWDMVIGECATEVNHKSIFKFPIFDTASESSGATSVPWTI